jgi:hypothetical protein
MPLLSEVEINQWKADLLFQVCSALRAAHTEKRLIRLSVWDNCSKGDLEV